MFWSNLSSFLLLFGCVRCVMNDNLRLLLSNNVSCCELWCVRAYFLQVLARFFDDYLWFVGLFFG